MPYPHSTLPDLSLCPHPPPPCTPAPVLHAAQAIRAQKLQAMPLISWSYGLRALRYECCAQLSADSAQRSPGYRVTLLPT